MESRILCRSCNFFVLGEKRDSGFCLCRDLFTHTEETECADYAEGEPMTEEEYENWS